MLYFVFILMIFCELCWDFGELFLSIFFGIFILSVESKCASSIGIKFCVGILLLSKFYVEFVCVLLCINIRVSGCDKLGTWFASEERDPFPHLSVVYLCVYL
eukprot:GHVR01084962.1.p1 GENE.GHVR01084962.1~~GHVR01084962.1.p1  ORF type:complete len:102 (+),score=5.38 GHVR01084962.1:352-657(+)